MTFDLHSFGRWQAPGLICRNCRAIYLGKSISFKAYASKPDAFRHLRIIYEDHDGIWGLKCSVCSYIFQQVDDFDQASPLPNPDHREFQMSYLDDMNLQVFAEISSAFPPHADMQNATLDKTLFDYLLIAIAEAKTFIHFSTWNIDETILEALVKASRKVKVQGIVGKPDYAKAYGRIQGLQHQKVSQGYNIDFRIQNEVHSKFIIFDGLICFVGSANLTKFAWEKANNFDQRTGKAVLKEIIQVISKPYDVIEFNNIYFSPNWILESSDFDDLF